MKRLLLMGMVAFGALVFGCVAPGAAEPESEGDGPLGSASQAQVDPGMRYLVYEAGTLEASVFPVVISGQSSEIWALKSPYQNNVAREFNGASQTCAGWKRSVCDGSYSTFYQAVITSTTLNCALPPGPCTPPSGSTTLLANGSYAVYDSIGVPFAWTYVAGGCEYWSMNHLISSGVSDQSAYSPAWSSLSNFETAMCAKSPVPSNWYTVSYVPITNFCSTFTC